MTYLSPGFVAGYADRSPDWGFDGLGYVVYKRTYARPVLDVFGDRVRTEEWHETVARVVNGAQDIGANLTPAEAERLFDYIWNLKALPGGRMLWQLGTDNNTRIGGDSLVNCWFVNLQTPEDFRWMFERLMLGGGVGFSITDPDVLGSVKLARIQHENVADADFIVPDKREGWAELIERVLYSYLGDHPAEWTYSTMLVRPEGAPIKTFGGTASGPGILIEGVEAICQVLDGAVGRHLTSVEVLDIANIIGSIVVSGNVRRSAQIALGSSHDTDYLQAKRWDLGNIPNFRAMSNNTVYLNDFDHLTNEVFWDGYLGKGEPYGLFNLAASQKYGRMGEVDPDYTIDGVNPCAEIPLAHRESCNLSELVLPRFESAEEMADAAKLLYKVQKAVAALPYLDPESDAVTSANMRLGLGVTGLLQATGAQLSWLDPTYRALQVVDAAWSREMGYPQSVRLTTVKPSGTLSLLAGVTPGVHPGFSEFHIRRVRMATTDPLVEWCRAKGYPVEPVRNFDGTDDPRTVVVEFPARFPKGTIFADEVSAIDQLEFQARAQEEWSDNAVSVTVYFTPDELPAIRDYLRENWHQMKSVSFLPKVDHGFDQAPLEAISKEEYERRVAALHDHDIAVGEGVSDFLDADCATGACPIR